MYLFVPALLLFVCGSVFGQIKGTDFTWEDRWKYYIHRTYSPERMSLLAVDTALDHAVSSGGLHPVNYADRYAGAFATRIARTTIELGVGGWLHEDARRRASGLTSFRRRLSWALTHSMTARGPDGNVRPAWSRFAGTAGGFLVISSWNARPITVGRLGGAFSNSVLFNIQDSLLNEFEPELRRTGLRVARACFGRFTTRR